jgi:hypothetical protein
MADGKSGGSKAADNMRQDFQFGEKSESDRAKTFTQANNEFVRWGKS